MKKQILNLNALLIVNCLLAIVNCRAQNIGINTTGAAPATTNMLEILQPSNTDATIGLYINHSGGSGGTGTRYAFQAINNGASLNNIAAYLSATGGTNNYALIIPATGGNVGIGDDSPAALFTVGNGDLFQVNSSGAVAAAAGIISAGTIRFSALITNGVVRTTSGNGTLSSSGGAINLTSEVTGVLPLANGGSSANLTAVNGGTVYSTGTAMAITAAGTSGQVLTSNGAAAPTWSTISSHTQSHAITSSSDHTAGAWKVFYSNGSGVVNELGLGAAGTVLTSGGAAVAPSFATGSSGWGLTGNAGTTPGTNFLGTTDTKDMLLKINSLDAFRVHYDATFQKTFAFGGYNVGDFSSVILDDMEFRTESQTGIMISQFNNYAWGNTLPDGPTLKLTRARGNSSTPATLVNGDWLGEIIFTAPGSGYWPEPYHAAIASQARATAARAADLRFYTVSSGEAGNFWTYERMRLGPGGGLGINLNTGGGNDDPYAYLHVFGGIGIGPGATTSGAISLTEGLRNSIQISTDLDYGGTYNDHSGFLIYSIMPGGWGTSELHFAGSTNWATYNTATPAVIIRGTGSASAQLQINGNVCYTGAIVACSDQRYKKDIVPMTNSLYSVMKLQGVNYYWKKKEFPDKNFSSDKQIGFIAQDIEKIFPEVVMTDKDGYKSVDYSRLTPILVEAIKEQEKTIQAQQKMITDLTSDLKSVKDLVGSLKVEMNARFAATNNATQGIKINK